MTTFIRKILMTLLGLIAAAAVWASLEILLKFGEKLGGYLMLSLSEGILVGGLFGFFFGTAEGILLTERGRALRGGLAGLLIGVWGGAAAVLLAQGLLYFLENADLFSRMATGRYVIPISRSVGWIVLGMLIGSIDGIRTGSLRRVGIGLSGGLLGGLAGGLALEFFVSRWNNSTAARGAGLGIMGGFIGLFYSIFEYSRAFGIIKVLTGRIKGKEYIISMRRTRIGVANKCGIILSGYDGVEKVHAELIAGKDGVTVKSRDGVLVVNEDKVKEAELKYEDVIQLGSARLYYLPR